MAKRAQPRATLRFVSGASACALSLAVGGSALLRARPAQMVVEVFHILQSLAVKAGAVMPARKRAGIVSTPSDKAEIKRYSKLALEYGFSLRCKAFSAARAGEQHIANAENGLQRTHLPVICR